MKKLYIIIILFFSINSFSQSTWIGINTLYNVQTESLGLGIHFKKDIKKTSLSPFLTYYPKNNFNKINEAIFGVDLNYNFYKYKKLRSYALLSFGYNAWINYNESYLSGAQYNNLNTELGIAFRYNSCISPFIELRYSIKWMECTIKAGVSIALNCPKKRKINIKDLPNYSKQD